MSNKFNNQQFVSEPEDSENSPENSAGDSPRSAVSADTKLASTSSSKKSRRAVQKRVVSVAIKDVEGFRLKGDQMSAPPSDSWAWRKYGQKPIKGSPHPRGYYRCSSSKGCPARKQVERSRTDSKMLVITYYCEHNHPWPASRNHRSAVASAAAATPRLRQTSQLQFLRKRRRREEEEEDENKKYINLSNINNSNNNNNKSCNEIVNPDYRYSNLGHEGQISQASEFGWLSDFEFTNCGMLESPILSEDIEMATIFTMREEDEPLFADLGELPECSAVFRRGMAEREAEQRRRRPPGLATTG